MTSRKQNPRRLWRGFSCCPGRGDGIRAGGDPGPLPYLIDSPPGDYPGPVHLPALAPVAGAFSRSMGPISAPMRSGPHTPTQGPTGQRSPCRNRPFFRASWVTMPCKAVRAVLSGFPVWVCIYITRPRFAPCAGSCGLVFLFPGIVPTGAGIPGISRISQGFSGNGPKSGRFWPPAGRCEKFRGIGPQGP